MIYKLVVSKEADEDIGDDKTATDLFDNLPR